jgi:hypothetical protein
VFKKFSIIINCHSPLKVLHIDKITVQNELYNTQKSPEKVPTKIKKIIANPMFTELISNILN